MSGEPKLPGQRYREERERRKMARRAVADALDMPYSTLADWENGNFRLPARVPLGVLCRHLGVREEYILTGKGDPDLPPTDRHVFWGHALSEEAAALGADWLRLLERDPETAATFAATLRSTVKGLIDAERRGAREQGPEPPRPPTPPNVTPFTPRPR